MSDQEWIVVRNWWSFQHYKDRTVPWIKFYAELLHDDAWLGLPPRTRSLLCGIWLLYMSSRCALRADTRRLTRALNQQVTRSDLELLNHAGFITLESSPKSEDIQSATRPTRAREERPKGREERRGANAPTGAAPDANKNGRRRDPYQLAEAFTRNTLVNYPESDRRIALAEYHLTPDQENQLLALAAELETPQ